LVSLVFYYRWVGDEWGSMDERNLEGFQAMGSVGLGGCSGCF